MSTGRKVPECSDGRKTKGRVIVSFRIYHRVGGCRSEGLLVCFSSEVTVRAALGTGLCSQLIIKLRRNRLISPRSSGDVGKTRENYTRDEQTILLTSPLFLELKVKNVNRYRDDSLSKSFNVPWLLSINLHRFFIVNNYGSGDGFGNLSRSSTFSSCATCRL